MPGGIGGAASSAFNNDPTVDRAMFDRLRAGRSLEEVCDPDPNPTRTGYACFDFTQLYRPS